MKNTHHNKHDDEWKENKDSEGGGHSFWRTLLWNAEHVLEKTETNKLTEVFWNASCNVKTGNSMQL